MTTTTMTTMAARPTAWDTLEEALRRRRPVRLTYHGHQRILCPHALGWKNNRAMVLAYQTGGHTTTGKLSADPQRRWRNLLAADIDHAAIADPTATWQTADNYNHSRPFNSIDRVSIAIVPTDPPHPS